MLQQVFVSRVHRTKKSAKLKAFPLVACIHVCYCVHGCVSGNDKQTNKQTNKQLETEWSFCTFTCLVNGALSMYYFGTFECFGECAEGLLVHACETSTTGSCWRSVCLLGVAGSVMDMCLLQMTVPAVPVFLRVSGLYEVEYQISVACRDACVYTIKEGGRVPKFRIPLGSQPCGMQKLDLSVVVACMNQTLTSYTVKVRDCEMRGSGCRRIVSVGGEYVCMCVCMCVCVCWRYRGGVYGATIFLLRSQFWSC